MMTIGLFPSCLAGLPPMARAAQRQFQEGGSLTHALLLLFTIGAIVGMTIFVGVLMARHARMRRDGEAWRVFEESIEKLKLTAAQQRYLRALATHHPTENPNVLLLSPAIFDRRAVEFAGPAPATGSPADAAEATRRARLLIGSQLREVLFERAGHGARSAG